MGVAMAKKFDIYVQDLDASFLPTYCGFILSETFIIWSTGEDFPLCKGCPIFLCSSNIIQ